jgi:ribonuclease VapC
LLRRPPELAGRFLSAPIALPLRGRAEGRFDVPAIPFGDEHRRQAGTAFARYGKGRHLAGLDFGDCLAYAVARLSGPLLLCVGGDFAQTDLALVPPAEA